MDPDVLSDVASTTSVAVVCWNAGLKTQGANGLIKKAGAVAGSQLATLEEVVEQRMLPKLLTIVDNTSHLHHKSKNKLRSSFND